VWKSKWGALIMTDINLNVSASNGVSNISQVGDQNSAQLSSVLLSNTDATTSSYDSSVTSDTSVATDVTQNTSSTQSTSTSTPVTYSEAKASVLAQIDSIKGLDLEADIAPDIAGKAATATSAAVPASRSASNQAAQTALEARNASRTAYNQELTALKSTFTSEFEGLDSSKTTSAYNKALTKINGDATTTPPILSQAQRLDNLASKYSTSSIAGDVSTSCNNAKTTLSKDNSAISTYENKALVKAMIKSILIGEFKKDLENLGSTDYKV